jgi:hypothetical protein
VAAGASGEFGAHGAAGTRGGGAALQSSSGGAEAGEIFRADRRDRFEDECRIEVETRLRQRLDTENTERKAAFTEKY